MTSTFLTVIALMGVGLAYRVLPGVPLAAEVRRGIGAIVFNFLLPALTFHVLSTAPLHIDLVTVPVTAIATVLTTLVIGWVVYGRLLHGKLSAPTTGSLLIAAVWCNATYLGLPIVTGAIGEHVQRVPIIFDLLGMSPMLFTVGVMMCMHYGTRDAGITFAQSLRQLLLLPPLLAAFAGLCVNVTGIPIPSVVTVLLSQAGSIVAPLMIISVGLGLAPFRIKWLPWIIPAFIIKLVVAPFIGYVVALPLMGNTDVFRATVLEAGMPTMMITMVFADRYGLDGEMLAQVIVVTTVASMLTLPLLLQFIS